MPVSRRTLLVKKYAAMRVVSDWVDRQREQERQLMPPYGTVGVGGADFDYLLKAVVGEAYLRALRRGGTVEDAHADAVRDGNHCVQRWNDRTHKTRASIHGAYELKRWDKAGESEADHLHRWFLSMVPR